MERWGKIKSHRGISFLSVQESSPSLCRDHFVPNFSHLSTCRQVSWEKTPGPQTMGRTGAACLGLGLGSRQGSLQVTLNVGDWGDHAKWPCCPSQGPLKPNGICHKSGSQGTWEAQPRELQSRQTGGHRPCSGNKHCASAKQCCLSIGLGFPKWAIAAWRHTGTRNCSEISLWTCGERTFEKSLAPVQWASQGAWAAGRA